MSGGVANNDGARAATDRRGIKTLDSRGIAASGVFRHVHGIEAQGDGKLDGLFGGLEKEVVGPIFGVAADGARSDKSRGFYGEAGALDDFGDGADVVLVSAGGAVGLNV